MIIADQESAVVRRLVLTSSEVLDEGAEENVEGTAVESVHKPRENALKHKQIQHTSDEATKRNIRDVVSRVEQIAKRWNPDVLVLAGEIQGRRLLHQELPEALRDISREVESGGGIPSGSADDGAEQSLRQDLSTLARQHIIERTKEQTDRFNQLEAQDQAVEGAEKIRRAVQLGAVETLLLRYDQRAEGEDELLNAAASVDASVGLVATGVSEDVAAILRYAAPVDEVE